MLITKHTAIMDAH